VAYLPGANISCAIHLVLFFRLSRIRKRRSHHLLFKQYVLQWLRQGYERWCTLRRDKVITDCSIPTTDMDFKFILLDKSIHPVLFISMLTLGKSHKIQIVICQIICTTYKKEYTWRLTFFLEFLLLDSFAKI
jgi:hypothetical protein